jgi:hypothetical protein
MAEDRRTDLEFRLRNNRGRLLVADFSIALSEACGVKVAAQSFLSIQQTEELKKPFFTRVRDERERPMPYWQKQDRACVVAYCHDLGRDIGPHPVILFSSIDRYVGAVRLPADSILQNAMSVWSVVKDDLSLATEDLQNGLCLEENFYTPGGEYMRDGIFDLTAWGIFGRDRSDSE